MSISKPLCILFADVSGSTKLFETLGDVEARRVISAVLDMLSHVCVAHQGKVVKTIGDEVMCTLPDAYQGITAACEMQKRVAENIDFMRYNIAIRIGLHYGNVLIEAEDVFGDAVNVAARMAELAKRLEIITTVSTFNSLPTPSLFRFRGMGETRVSGKATPLEIIDIIWNNDAVNTTLVQSGVFRKAREAAPPNASKITLRYQDITLNIDEHSPPFTVGRDAESSLRVNVENVSRVHAWIEFKKGYFIFSDRSTNGSIIKFSDDDKLRLHRSETQLRLSGEIILGTSKTQNGDNTVYFQCHYDDR